MNEVAKKRRGESIKIKCTAPLELSEYENIRVVVYNKKKTVIVKASMNAYDDYDTDIFELDPIDDTVFYIQVLETVTSEAQLGDYWIEAEGKQPEAGWKTLSFFTKSYEPIFNLDDSPQLNSEIS